MRAAIEQCVSAYEMKVGAEGEPTLLMEYVVFTCHRGFDDEGGNARYNWFVQDEGGPWHHILGLVDEGKRQLLRDQAEAFRED
jgi:hypothetical protein